MSTFPSELDTLLSQPAPQLEDNEEEGSLEQHVQDQVDQLGQSPSLVQAVTVLLKQSARSELEARQARQQQHTKLVETVKVLKEHHTDIEGIKEKVNTTEVSVEEVKKNQTDLEKRMLQMEYTANKAYNLACENRQRQSKGNFILSGRHLPKARYGENLLAIAREVVFRKYEVDIYPQEFKALHRLAGDRILFTLNCRMPGWSYEHLIRNMNSNPKPELEVYLSIQLFEPYSDLYYIARRLKFHRVISYYRLDENGNSYVALSEQSKAFKFTSLYQLQQLQIQIPQDLYNELYERRRRNIENENKVAADNLKKAFENRPNLPVESQQNPNINQATGSALLTAARAQHAGGQAGPPPDKTEMASTARQPPQPGSAPAQQRDQPQYPRGHPQQAQQAVFQPAVPPPTIPNSQPRFRFTGRDYADTARRPSTKRGRSSSAASAAYSGREGSFTASPVFDSNQSGWSRPPPWYQYQGQQQYQLQQQQFSSNRQ